VTRDAVHVPINGLDLIVARPISLADQEPRPVACARRCTIRGVGDAFVEQVFLADVTPLEVVPLADVFGPADSGFRRAEDACLQRFVSQDVDARIVAALGRSRRASEREHGIGYGQEIECERR
jgi:hypothetical protein